MLAVHRCSLRREEACFKLSGRGIMLKGGSMEEVLVSGLSRGELNTHVANGKIIRIGSGIYTWREPTPMEVARILHKRWPGIMLAGSSAVQLYSKKAMTFPLKFAYKHVVSGSQWFEAEPIYG